MEWQAPIPEAIGKDGGGLANAPRQPQPQRYQYMNNEEINAVADLVAAKIICCTKEVLTSEEAARYMGISLSHLYKLTMRQAIPHYKPTGKVVYFNRAEVEQWLQNNRISTVNEAQAQAEAYCRKGGVL